MKSDKEIILEKSAKEYFESAEDEFKKERYNSAVVLYFESAEDEFKKERYNSAVVLYFKSLISLTDLYILKETNDTPSSHSDRFRKLQKDFPEIYNIIDKDFPFYQDSYNQIMTKELAEVIKEDAQTLAEKTQTKLS